MVSCAEYCMFISAPGSIFLFYLAVLVSFGSETVYSVPKNRFESSVVLFLASFVYAALFAFSYYTKYMTIERQENVERWINEREIKQIELETLQPQQQQTQPVQTQAPPPPSSSQMQKSQASSRGGSEFKAGPRRRQLAQQQADD